MPPQVDELTRASLSAPSGAAKKPSEPVQLQLLIDSSTDPKRVAQYLGEFKSRHSQVFEALTDDPERLVWLTTIFSSS
ncbi:MAG TPA: hypothetical protein VN517_01220, partial [Terriglobales bacterium]|nr:hypothetical protein [Terriglobales bacterium]